MKEEMKKNGDVSIKIILSKEDEIFSKDIFWGIEEEGIPYMLEYLDKDIIDLENINIYAYNQAKKSKLSLGIAICKNRAVFHYTKLNENKPLFVLNNLQDCDRVDKRIYGSNIARVVKGIPLKNI